MKHLFFLFMTTLFFTSCSQTITNEDLKKINGYWEIEKVVLVDGSKKEYVVNEAIDYFEIKANKGFRKKVVPQLDGTYLINNQFENIEIIEDKESFYILYNTKYTKFREQIIELRDSVLVLKTKQNVFYHYKKSIPFSVK